MIIAAIDTDAKGAVVKFNTDTNEIQGFPLPNHFAIVSKKKRLRLDMDAMNVLFADFLSDVDHIFFEDQNARPGQGVTSMFSFGRTFGRIESMAVAHLPEKAQRHYVTGRVWKSSLGITKDKKSSINLATLLAPDAKELWRMVKWTSVAEAWLICFYGCGKLGIPVKRKPIKNVTKEI